MLNFTTFFDSKMNEDWILLETTPPVCEALKTESAVYAMDNGYTPHLVLPMATVLKNSNY